MSTDLILLGKKIMRQREYLLLSVAEVSFGTGINEDRIRWFEEGALEPSGDEILILADFFQCDFKELISNEVDLNLEKMEMFYRAHGVDFSKQDRRSIQEFLFLCESESQLNELYPDHGRIEFKPVKQGTYFKGHGQNAAVDFRKAIGLSDGEVSVDIYRDFRKCGVHIFRRILENSNISGLFIRHPKAGKCILVNYIEDVFRQRFTVSHEFSHSILDDDKDFIVSKTKWEKNDLIEIRANAFAAEFLVPTALARDIGKRIMNYSQSEIVDLLLRIKVSPAVLANSLNSLGDIDAKTVEMVRNVRISSEFKKDPELEGGLSKGYRSIKKKLLERGLSTHYVELCFRAYQDKSISIGKLSEFLLCEEADLIGLAEMYNSNLTNTLENEYDNRFSTR